MKIKEFSKDERPRERMLSFGAEIILRVGSKNENVIEMSQKILSKYPVEKLSDPSIKELCNIKGIGEAKALQIKAIFELNKRSVCKKIVKISSPKNVFEYFSFISNKKQENFYILCLDSKNQIISHKLIAIGTLDSVIIHPREVFKEAIKESAQNIILVHNHPSGDPTPSLADKEITKKLETASEIIKIDLLDHIIIGKDKWFSFDDEGII